MYTNNMRFLRKEKKMTLGQLSLITNISKGYLCHLEIGSRKNPSNVVMDKIAIALNKSIYEVFFLDFEKNK
jgi:Predicted transcriptional regulators